MPFSYKQNEITLSLVRVGKYTIVYNVNALYDRSAIVKAVCCVASFG